MGCWTLFPALPVRAVGGARQAASQEHGVATRELTGATWVFIQSSRESSHRLLTPATAVSVSIVYDPWGIPPKVIWQGSGGARAVTSVIT